jgi:two-component system, NarL family, sensor histidine kinase UhpB
MGKVAAVLSRSGLSVWWFAPALLSSLLMFGTIGWHVYNTFRVERELEADAGRSEELRNRICLLHQQLASNAVMVVASGDPRSEHRQRELAAGLTAALVEAREQGPVGYNLSALWDAHEAHDGLRGIEDSAISMAKQGQVADALTLLSNADYQGLQDRFSRSAARFIDDYRRLLDQRLLGEAHKELGSLAIAFLIFMVTVGVWLFLMTRLRAREQALRVEVAEREKAERTLQQREAVLSQAQEIARLGSFERDPRTGTERWSDEFYRILGYAPSAFPPSQPLFFDRVHSDDLARLRRAAEAAATSTDGYNVEVRIVRPSGEERSVSLRAKLERDSDGVVVRTVGTLYDSTEQKQIEARVEQSRQQLRSLAVHLLSVREQERAAVAKEIHDDVGQIVAAVRMDLVAAQRKLGTGNRQQQEQIEHASGLLGQVVETVQRVMSELRPPVLDDVGLAAAIEWQLGQFQKRTGMRCELVSEVAGRELSAEGNLALFRVLQEALSNVAQHARATAVEVRLARSQDWLELEITDNGRGISQADLQGQQSFGILGMRERVRVVRGELQIRATESGGTQVLVRAPIADTLAGSAIPLAP